MSERADAFFVTRTMLALELLCFQTATAPEVASALGVHPGTSRRLLDRFVTDGWLTRSGGYRRLYAPTMRVVAMAAHLAARDPLALAAQPIVTTLHDETRGVAHLCIPELQVGALPGASRGWSGRRAAAWRSWFPAHASAAGKILLAFRPPWRAGVLAEPLEARTDRTIVDPELVEQEARLARERSYATEDEELQTGVRGVAVPVWWREARSSRVWASPRRCAIARRRTGAGGRAVERAIAHAVRRSGRSRGRSAWSPRTTRGARTMLSPASTTTSRATTTMSCGQALSKQRRDCTACAVRAYLDVGCGTGRSFIPMLPDDPTMPRCRPISQTTVESSRIVSAARCAGTRVAATCHPVQWSDRCNFKP